jgi:hypothetical protein
MHPVAAASARTASGGTPSLDPPARQLTGQQIVAVLSSMDALQSETLHWQTSVVDLLKLLGVDPSPANLSRLAQELTYEGDRTDSTAMHVWLHGALMQKLIHGGD